MFGPLGGGHNVRVNAVLPTFIDTELVRSNVGAIKAALGTEFLPIIEAKQGRLGTVEDVVPLL